MAKLIRYRRANTVSASGQQQSSAPEAVEYEAGKVLNIIQATQVNTAVSTAVGDGAFEVDEETHKPVTEALDKSPFVYRAGGEGVGAAGASTD